MKLQNSGCTSVAAVACLLVLPTLSASQVVIDGQSNCVSIPDLLSNWVEVALTAGPRTIILEDSDFGSSPGAENHMVCVYCDHLNPTSYDHWFFTLNGIGDSADVTFVEGGRIFLGFVDTESSDNHGGSVVTVSGLPTGLVVDGTSHCAEVPAMMTVFHHEIGSCNGWYKLTLTACDFGSSPGAENHIAFILGDRINPDSYDYWLFTLNGIDDSMSLFTFSGASFYLGFIDTYAGDNHGTSTIDIDCPTPTDENTWGGIKALFR